MRVLSKVFICGFVVLTMGLATAFAQGPIQKTVHFNVNVPYTIRKARYTLPAGNYILRQVSANDRKLFALYRGNMMHSPIAMITTVPIYHVWPFADNDTKMIYRIDEQSEDAHPIIRGWNVAGDDGWEIIGIVPNRELRAETRSR